jgi:hypothetical protein
MKAAPSQPVVLHFWIPASRSRWAPSRTVPIGSRPPERWPTGSSPRFRGRASFAHPVEAVQTGRTADPGRLAIAARGRRGVGTPSPSRGQVPTPACRRPGRCGRRTCAPHARRPAPPTHGGVPPIRRVAYQTSSSTARHSAAMRSRTPPWPGRAGRGRRVAAPGMDWRAHSRVTRPLPGSDSRPAVRPEVTSGYGPVPLAVRHAKTA